MSGRHDIPPGLLAAHIDALRRASSAGARLAGSALSQLSGLNITLDAPWVECVALDDVPALLGGRDSPIVALRLGLLGEARGDFLFTMDPAMAARLLEALVPGERARMESLTDLQRSALLEVGNIVAGAYVNAMGSRIGRGLRFTVPDLAIDMAGAVLDGIIVESSSGEEASLVIRTCLAPAASTPHHAACLEGQILLLPDPAIVSGLVAALGGPPASREV